jgi:hypothetical protein
LLSALYRLFSAGGASAEALRARCALVRQWILACAAALALCDGMRLLSVSILVAFDAADATAQPPRACLIDFAHAYMSDESGAAGADQNVISALQSLAELLLQVEQGKGHIQTEKCLS